MKNDSKDSGFWDDLVKKKKKAETQKIGKKLKPALSGFARFVIIWTRKSIEFIKTNAPEISKRLRPVGAAIKNFKKTCLDFIKSNNLDRHFFYPLALLLIFVLIPWISRASMSQEAYMNLITPAPIDPIEAGQFASDMNQYTPTIYVDPDVVVLNQIANDPTYTLSQQLLSVNGGKPEQIQRAAATYTIKPGETITQIAQNFNLHVGTILDANNIQPGDMKKLKAGVVLDIPSSDTNVTNDWLVAVNKAEEEAKQQAAAAAAATLKKQRATAAKLAAGTSLVRSAIRTVSSSVSIIGVSFEQCLPWARAQTGIQIHGYAGDVSPNSQTPSVGVIALDRFFGHASVVVGVGGDYIVVHEANWIRGKITERTVSKSAIRGYVY